MKVDVVDFQTSSAYGTVFNPGFNEVDCMNQFRTLRLNTNMIYTSNFAKSGTQPNAVSIATGSPAWFRGETKECLFPGWKLVKGHKSKQISDSEYVTEYAEQLKLLDVHEIAKELDNKVLLCWCKSDVFCHRHIVRKWLQHHGYECEEI